MTTVVSTCSKKYIGQTGRPIETQFPEHFRDFKHGNSKSSFAQHLLENWHSTSPIENIMATIHITNKVQMMDTLKKFYLFHEMKINIRLTTS